VYSSFSIHGKAVLWLAGGKPGSPWPLLRPVPETRRLWRCGIPGCA